MAQRVNITTKRRENLFGFGGRKPAPVVKRKRRPGSGLSLREASAAALKAGKKSGDLSDFDSWLERKRMDQQSDGFISRVRDSYSRGVDQADAKERNREFLKDKREAARERAKDAAEERRADSYHKKYEREKQAGYGEYFGTSKQPRGRASKAAAVPAATGYASAPDEATIQRGFKQGKTLNEILRGNPALRKRWQKLNPAAASAQVFEEFHGYQPSEVITVSKQVHYHQHLAAAGKLTHLDVWGVDQKGHKVTGFKGAFLAFNEEKNQLFVEGGDQSVNLRDFGMKSPHELETLGQLTDIGYHTNKVHLGREGGEAVYVHKFRSTNVGGKHVVVKIARYPDLIYDVRNEQLLFSGGSYEIIAEGINK